MEVQKADSPVIWRPTPGILISILAALLLPALGRAKAKAQQPVCVNHLRQIGLAIRMYAEDFQMGKWIAKNRQNQ